MTFAAYLKQARETAGMTQEELAEKSGIKRSFIGLLEADKRTPPISCLTHLADALGMPQRQRRRLMVLAALRHLKPDFRAVMADSLARLDKAEARLQAIEAADQKAEK